MNKLLPAILALTALTFSACGHTDTEEINMLVAPNSLPARFCGSLEPRTCLVVKMTRPGDAGRTWMAWPGGDIEGFSYEPGYLYDLTVTATTYSVPFGDPNPASYVLKRINSKVASDETRQPGQP